MNTYITIKDAAKILGVTKLTLRNWDKSGKLKAYRHPFNNYRVYKMEDIENVIDTIGTSPDIIEKKKDEVRKLRVLHLEESNENIEEIEENVYREIENNDPEINSGMQE